MRRIVAVLLVVAMVLTGCSFNRSNNSSEDQKKDVITNHLAEEEQWTEIQPEYNSLDDKKFLSHIEDAVYRDVVKAVDSTEYVIENVKSIYVSKEYLEEVAFNSQENVFFGYGLSELDEMFQGSRYIFTLGDNGSTTVQELQVIENNSTEKMLKNIAVGAGVILVCVTISAVTATAAPAVSVIFAASATTAKSFAISSAVFGGVSAGIMRGIETGDFGEALEAAALGASEGFKWGAISGALSGGGAKALQLKQGTKGGLSMNEVASIQRESCYPMEVIKRFNSMEQYKICKSAGLSAKMVDGKTALVRKIDLNYVDELTGKTNLQLMIDGYAPYDPTGHKYQLHHIGQKNDSPLAILTKAEHTGKGNNSVWHTLTEGFENPSSQPGWSKIREDFWKNYAEQVISGGI